MTPTVARHLESRTFFEPDGNLILVLPVSWLCEMMTAELPEALASLPRSPTFISIEQQAVPSGIFPIGSTLPMWRVALLPQYTDCPVVVPSAATKVWVFLRYLYGSLNATRISGAPLPGSWMMSLTTPLINPCLSAKSIDRYLAGPLRVRVRALKIPPAPLRQARMIRPISNYLLDNRNRTQK